MTTSIQSPLLSVPSMVEAAVRRVRSEHQRATVLITGAAKYRRLSTLHEQEARLWTLLVRHTAEPVHRRAATDAQCAARARAREYAEFAQHWPALDTDHAEQTPVTARPPLADRCEVCGRPLISRRVRRQGRCGAHPRQPVIPRSPTPTDAKERRDESDFH